jgi:hypothetical protein
MSTAVILIKSDSAAAFTTAVNAALAALVNPTIISAAFFAQNPQRRVGEEHGCAITYTTGGAVLATPFLLSVLEAVTITDLNTLMVAFQLAQAAGFVAGSRFRFLDEGIKQAKYITWTLYNATPGASANYMPVSGGGGGGGV